MSAAIVSYSIEAPSGEVHKYRNFNVYKHEPGVCKLVYETAISLDLTDAAPRYGKLEVLSAARLNRAFAVDSVVYFFDTKRLFAFDRKRIEAGLTSPFGVMGSSRILGGCGSRMGPMVLLTGGRLWVAGKTIELPLPFDLLHGCLETLAGTVLVCSSFVDKRCVIAFVAIHADGRAEVTKELVFKDLPTQIVFNEDSVQFVTTGYCAVGVEMTDRNKEEVYITTVHTSGEISIASLGYFARCLTTDGDVIGIAIGDEDLCVVDEKMQVKSYWPGMAYIVEAREARKFVMGSKDPQGLFYAVESKPGSVVNVFKHPVAGETLSPSGQCDQAKEAEMGAEVLGLVCEGADIVVIRNGQLTYYRVD
ncbi:hypothetical protein Pmar_PMAR024005 [Perkinsus marinus ATCC 50983]|uniref:Uncharacterized protein n=1 Tax=Perkinsus marinus (strain ATCC 50983 / TXsc) TaxID=423536 RepID=C5LEH5_PERM5|nr:hypothetical protein Pmar_PMAR024005 [Perkinsus marinus ATCC 50983]EER04868.1 hypothetical protein Pmar_PMAR024005 [Perkinsus marinus ATCC 50983]|eukprot:XP_002773052.1 hypothetical protein Pmar_PMAR024005 [Perkinsus marinus ATCC 50983]